MRLLHSVISYCCSTEPIISGNTALTTSISPAVRPIITHSPALTRGLFEQSSSHSVNPLDLSNTPAQVATIFHQTSSATRLTHVLTRENTGRIIVSVSRSTAATTNRANNTPPPPITDGRKRLFSPSINSQDSSNFIAQVPAGSQHTVLTTSLMSASKRENTGRIIASGKTPEQKSQVLKPTNTFSKRDDLHPNKLCAPALAELGAAGRGKVDAFQILKKNYRSILPDNPAVLFSFELRHVLTDGSFHPELASAILKILTEKKTDRGILLTDDRDVDMGAIEVRDLISACIKQSGQDGVFLDPSDITSRIKLMANGGKYIIDFFYQRGEITYSRNRDYEDIKKEYPGTKTATAKERDMACHAPPKIVLINEELRKGKKKNDYLQVVDLFWGMGSIDTKARTDRATGVVNAMRQSGQVLQLAMSPQEIAGRLLKDQEFMKAYHAFIDDLTRLGNGIIRVHDAALLRQQNHDCRNRKPEKNSLWHRTPVYSDLLDKLTRRTNPAISVENCAIAEVEKSLIDAMKATPDKPVCWTINGNNYIPTHQGLRSILENVAAQRALHNGTERPIKDIVIISGNAAGAVPYSVWPVVKFKSLTGEMVGQKTEAEAIKDLLTKDSNIGEAYEFILETEAQNTGENLKKTAEKLRQRDLDAANLIVVNSQSGFSGLRSALTSLGWQNEGVFPDVLYFINPDLDSGQATTGFSFTDTGKMVIQALREFSNLVKYSAKGSFIPLVSLPPDLVQNFKVCLNKIGIYPDRIGPDQISALLNTMNQIALVANKDGLVPEGVDYAAAGLDYSDKSWRQRRRESRDMESREAYSTEEM